MIIGDELGDWSVDRTRQRQTRADVDAFAQGWNHGAANRAFAAAIAAVRGRGAGALPGAVRTLFEDDGWFDELIESLAATMWDDPFFDPPFRHLNSDIHSGLLVYEDDLVSVAAGVTSIADLAARKSASRHAASIAFSGQVGILKFVRAGGARLSFWEAPPITERFTAATAGRCRKTGERALADGEILTIDGRFQSFVIEHAKSNLVILQATVKPDQAPLSVEYDARTHEYVGCAAADDSASRIQMIATLLRKLDGEGAFEAIAGFVGHPHFFVRWHVMRELLGLDAEAALPHLKRMAAGDPHPETRRAARGVLDRIQAPATALARRKRAA